MNKIAITADIDWAPEELLEYTISLLESFNVKCTFFCTHHSPVLLSANKELFELAIHPNFNPLLQGREGPSPDKIIDDLLALYPDAKGIRSHSMMQSSALLNLFAKKGFVYESNHFLPYHTNVYPFLLWNGMVRLPYVWEDDIHYMYGNKFDELKIDLDEPGMKIFDFHPTHLYINTNTEDHYLKAKPYYHDPAELWKLRNDGMQEKGAEDALVKLCSEIKEKNMDTFTLQELAGVFQATQLT